MKTLKTLETVCDRLKAEYRAHTIILYGSMADGSANADSDLDIAAFGPVARTIRVAEVMDGSFVDAFVYPEAILDAPNEEHLRFRGARILVQKAGSAEALLDRLDEQYEAGPKALPADELQARRTWARKMIGRAGRGDAEGHYRRAWLLTTLLEDYFHLRGLWFEGPKKALAWLKEHDGPTHQAIEAALVPGAPITTIQVPVEHVLSEHASSEKEYGGSDKESVSRHSPEAVTAKLNEVYDSEDSTVEASWANAQQRGPQGRLGQPE